MDFDLTYGSLGAGVQSSAVLAMSCLGLRGCPRADYFCFADTQSEPFWVYDHLEVLRTFASKHGMEIAVVTAGNLGADMKDRAAGALKASKTRSGITNIPAFIRNEEGSAGLLNRQCTSVYKISPLQAEARRRLGFLPGERIAGKKRVRVLMGISADEVQRMKQSRDKWLTNAYPLIDASPPMTRGDCEALLREVGLPIPRKSACTFCFAGDTKVVTPEGDRPIRGLVGVATLLVPTGAGHRASRFPHAGFGAWRSVRVRSFGVQALWSVTVVRGRARKTIRCTADHQWILRGEFKRVRTRDLKRGVVLDNCFRPPLSSAGSPVRVSSFGAAAGFVFGDGSLQAGRRPGQVTFYGKKDRQMMRFFRGAPMKRIRVNGKMEWSAWDLPRAWKEPPAVGESRSYLFGWLAGYFAADGTVAGSGRQATLYASVPGNLEIAKRVAYELGFRVSPIRGRMRAGFGKRRMLYALGICISDLPPAFFLLKHHRDSAAKFKPKYSQRHWTVVRVARTAKREEVFCATVPRAQAFTLSDNILTGNCPFRSDAEWLDLQQSDPVGFLEACQVDEAIRDFRAGKVDGEVYLHRSLQPLRQVDFKPKPRKAEQRLLDFGFGNECEGACGV